MTTDYTKDLFDEYGRPIVIATRTGRTATYVIAASDATAQEKAQADVVCLGSTATSTRLSASIANGVTGVVSSPGSWSTNTSKTVSTAGDFTVTIATGQNAIVTKGTANLGIPLISNANSGQKLLTVSSSDGFYTGDKVVIGDDSASESTNYIAKVVDNEAGTCTITMLNNLANTYTTAANAYITSRHVSCSAGDTTIRVIGTGTIYISGMGDEYEVNQAIIAASVNGGNVILLGKTISTRMPINIWPGDNPVSISGQSMFTPSIALASYSNCNAVEIKYITGRNSSVIPKISNLKIACNGYTGSLSHSSISTDGTSPSFCLITPANAVQTQGDGILYYSTSSTAGASGHDYIFENIIVGSAYRDGYRIESAWGVHMNNCYSEYCVRDGVYFWGSVSYVNQFFSSYNGRYQWFIGDACSALANATTHNSLEALTCYTNSASNTSLGHGIMVQYSNAQNNCFNNINLYGYLYYNAGSNWFITTYGSYDTWSNINITGFSSVRTPYGFNIGGIGCSFNNIQIINVNTTSINFISGSSNNTINTGRVTKSVTDNSGVYTNKTLNLNGFIASGEIRTFTGTIGTLTENAFNSLDNPFGQAVRVLSLDFYISTAAGDTTPNSTIDSGIGSSATTDYTDLFEGVDCEVTGFYNSTKTATVGKQTSPILWSSGSGNRYLNMSIKDAAATGMVCKYTVTVMGN